MKAVALLIFFVFSLFLASHAEGGEEVFTVQIDHFEDPSGPGFSKNSFEGRQWDLKSLLQSFQGRGGAEWIFASPLRSQGFGGSYCLRIRRSDGNNSPLSSSLRTNWLRQLLAQLGQRSLEMKMAGATFRVTHPSRCDLAQGRTAMAPLNAGLLRN